MVTKRSEPTLLSLLKTRLPLGLLMTNSVPLSKFLILQTIFSLSSSTEFISSKPLLMSEDLLDEKLISKLELIRSAPLFSFNLSTLGSLTTVIRDITVINMSYKMR
ncbi:hypothetical protein AMTRI_Chr13g87930 [Amborella trichopoda]